MTYETSGDGSSGYGEIAGWPSLLGDAATRLGCQVIMICLRSRIRRCP
jgi:hypothetical protein